MTLTIQQTLYTHTDMHAHMYSSLQRNRLYPWNTLHTVIHTHTLFLSLRDVQAHVYSCLQWKRLTIQETLYIHTHTHTPSQICMHTCTAVYNETNSLSKNHSTHTHTHTHTHTQACTSVYNETDSLLKKHSTHTHTHSQIGTHTHTHTHTQRANLSISHAHLPLPSSYTPSLFPVLVVKKSMDQCVCVKSSAIRHQEPISSISGNSPSLHCLQGRSFHTIATVVWRVVLQHELPSLASVISWVRASQCTWPAQHSRMCTHKMTDHMDRTSIEKGGTSGKVVEDSGVWGRGINLLLQKNISSSVTPSKKKKRWLGPFLHQDLFC